MGESVRSCARVRSSVFHVCNTSTYSQDAPVDAFALHHSAERVGIGRTVCAAEE